MDEPRKLLDLLNARENPEPIRYRGEVEAAWKTSSPEERREILDDLLMDTLLAENLGGPARARHRGRQIFLATAAAAALVLAAVAVWWSQTSGRIEPRPQLSGDFAALSKTGDPVSAQDFSRGDSVEAGASGARLALKDLFDLALTSGARVTWLGEKRSEVIEIHRGEVNSKVVPNKGRFTVRTPRGDISVVGTEFVTSVDYVTGPAGTTGAEREGLRKSAVVTVRVISGVVAYQIDGLSGRLDAGMSRTFAEEAVLARGEPVGANSQAAEPKEPAPGQVADGLQLTLVMDVTSMPCCIDKDGKVLMLKPGEDAPQDAEEREFKSQYLSVQLKNVSDKPIVLGFAASGGHAYGAQEVPFKVFARDAQGKELPRFASPEGVVIAPKAENEASTFTLLEPGQVMTEGLLRWMSSAKGATGKITVWVEFEQARAELTPDITTWGGKLNSNEVEYDTQSWFFEARDKAAARNAP